MDFTFFKKYSLKHSVEMIMGYIQDGLHGLYFAQEYSFKHSVEKIMD